MKISHLHICLTYIMIISNFALRRWYCSREQYILDLIYSRINYMLKPVIWYNSFSFADIILAACSILVQKNEDICFVKWDTLFLQVWHTNFWNGNKLWKYKVWGNYINVKYDILYMQSKIQRKKNIFYFLR